jgi:hypothetical protein
MEIKIDNDKKSALVIYFFLFGLPGILIVLAVIIAPLFAE